MSRLALSISTAILLSSCGVLKTYKNPEVEIPETYRGAISNDTTSIADIFWAEFFTDSCLNTLIAEGLANNFDMRVATERIRIAEANLGQAKAAFFPTVSLVGELNHSRQSNGSSGKDVLGYSNTSYSLGVATSWELDIWGKLRSQKKSADCHLAIVLCLSECGADLSYSEHCYLVLFVACS